MIKRLSPSDSIWHRPSGLKYSPSRLLFKAILESPAGETARSHVQNHIRFQACHAGIGPKDKVVQQMIAAIDGIIWLYRPGKGNAILCKMSVVVGVPPVPGWTERKMQFPEGPNNVHEREKCRWFCLSRELNNWWLLKVLSIKWLMYSLGVFK